MKRFLSLTCVFLLIFAVVSCGDSKKEEKPAYEEQVTQEISAEEGGTVKNSNDSVSIEVPGGALDEDLTITMTIYDAKGYVGTEGQKVVSKVVEFEPSGTVFKKPVIIRMAATEPFENQVVTAAVYRESKGEWSYSEHGAYAVLAGKDAAGDPIMQSAAGDPIMLSAAGDPIMMSAAGDPIMMSAAGDPIMLAAAGDPIMTNAAGDPIMNAAAGDPIMMTTGHFTAYTFITLDTGEPVEPDDTDNTDDSDTEEPVDDGDSEPAETDDDEPATETDDDEPIAETDDDEPAETDDDEPVDEDVVPEPTEPPVYSKVLCTGQVRCSDGESIIDCPKPGEDFYGQDAQFVAGKTCVVHKYSKGSEPVEPVVEEDPEGSGTGLRNILNGDSNNKNIRKGAFRDGETGETYEFVLDENTGLKWVFFDENGRHAAAESKCAALTYGGHEWRLPTVKEFLSIADHDRFASAVDESYFGRFGYWGFWASEPALAADDSQTDPHWAYNADWGTLDWAGIGQYGSAVYNIACVSGEEYGKRKPEEDYEIRNIGGQEVVFDPSSNLLWQKGSEQVEDWKSALAYCHDLEYAGYTDWRLPNKNELITIVDYSKVNPASSFPGITSDTLISSTFAVAYGGAENAIAVQMESGRVTEYYEEISVRCVRSSSHPLPDGRTIPYCDESRIAPCEDAATGYVWSSADLESNYLNYGSSLSWLDKAIQCRSLRDGGISKWRIPTIDEVRTLLSSSENLKTGGECHVTNECFDYLSEDCFNEEKCSPEEETGGKMIRSSLFDYSAYITGTLTSLEDTDYAWFVNLRNGSIERKAIGDYYTHESRCIKDDSLPDPVEFPYEDSDSGLVWFEGPRSKMYWYEASAYCHNLEVEGGSNNWRVPTMEEVMTLVRNCPAGNCMLDTAGKYSVFGDLRTLWTSTVLTEESASYLTALNFITASQMSLTDEYEEENVYCVRSISDPETESELDFPFEAYDLLWSKVSGYTTYSNSQNYCDSLNSANYGGYSNWRVPEISEIAKLIRKSVCPNKSDFVADEPSTGRCTGYSFDGYSIFGDMFPLKSSSDYYFDFAGGRMSMYDSGYVRCVLDL